MSSASSEKISCQEAEDWNDLCQDPQWMYNGSSGDEADEEGEPLYFARDWDSAGKFIVFIPVTDDMHTGALAPKWVFETAEPIQERPSDNSMATYQRRLLSFLCGRFVCITRPDADSKGWLQSSKGVPQSGASYYWRYWDNEQNVYEIQMQPWRRNIPKDGDIFRYNNVALNERNESQHSAPGDWSADQAWLRTSNEKAGGENGSGGASTNLPEFLEYLWMWKHQRTTLIRSWDLALDQLELSAGIFHRLDL